MVSCLCQRKTDDFMVYCHTCDSIFVFFVLFSLHCSPINSIFKGVLMRCVKKELFAWQIGVTAKCTFKKSPISQISNLCCVSLEHAVQKIGQPQATFFLMFKIFNFIYLISDLSYKSVLVLKYCSCDIPGNM